MQVKQVAAQRKFFTGEPLMRGQRSGRPIRWVSKGGVCGSAKRVAFDLPGQPWELPGLPWELPGQPLELPGLPWEVKGSPFSGTTNSTFTNPLYWPARLNDPC